MGKGYVVGLGTAEGFKHRHLHMIRSAAVMSAVPAMADVCTCCREERIRMLDPLRGINHGLGFDVVVLGQAFDLLNVKDGVLVEIGDFPLFL